ncbi:hypothetical protein LLB_1442 [Legionella longbeachae D-4968]|nr:hypothetical protein LLB_1442 [Legionella longbeachae D-4968]
MGAIKKVSANITQVEWIAQSVFYYYRKPYLAMVTEVLI